MKKINLKFLYGFPMGIMILFLSYILVYYVDGQSEYLKEISRLQDVKVLISQIVGSGIYYSAVALAGQIMLKIYDFGKEATDKELIKVSIVYIMVAVLVAMTMSITQGFSNFSTPESDLEGTVYGLGVLLAIVVVIIYLATDAISVKFINKKIKTRKAEEKNNKK
jgi:uncharacterized membrane protein